MKKPVLPLRIKDHMMLLGRTYTEDICGLSDETSPEYRQTFESAVNHFCSEWLEEQTGRKFLEKYSNPTVPPGFSIHLAFADELYEGVNSFLGKRVTDKKDREKFERQMKRAVTSLNSIFTSLESGLKKFSLGKSDFAFEKSLGIKGQPRSREVKEADRAQVLNKIKNRYRRAFTLSILLGMLKNFYSMDGKRITALVDSLLTDVNLKLLSTKEPNILFGEAIKRGMDKAFTNFDAVSEIEKEILASGFLKSVKNKGQSV